MDGLTLYNQLNQVLSEDPNTSTWIDDKTSFDYLYEAACEFVRETQCLTNSQTITPRAGVSLYDLSVDYFFLYLTDDQNRFYIKFNDGTTDWMVPHREYSAVKYGNVLTSQAIPDSFSVVDKRTLTSNITGTADYAAADTGFESTLTDMSATFLSTVSVGGIIHNTTDASSGIVAAVTSNTAIQTALFGGTDNDWTASDAYVIVPQGRKQLFFSPPFLSSAGTITVEYVQRPVPVYSYYRSYRFNPMYTSAIIKYAAFLYKYRDREPQFADAFYAHWNEQLKKFKSQENKSTQRTTWKVNFNKRAWTDRGLR